MGRLIRWIAGHAPVIAAVLMAVFGILLALQTTSGATRLIWIVMFLLFAVAVILSSRTHPSPTAPRARHDEASPRSGRRPVVERPL